MMTVNHSLMFNITYMYYLLDRYAVNCLINVSIYFGIGIGLFLKDAAYAIFNFFRRRHIDYPLQLVSTTPSIRSSRISENMY